MAGRRGANCSICNSPFLVAYTAAMTAGDLPQVKVASRFGFTRSAARRHGEHDPAPLAPGVLASRVVGAVEVTERADLHLVVPRLEALVVACQDAQARWSDKWQAQARFIRLEMDLLARIAEVSETRRRETISVSQIPQWRTVVEVLWDHPEVLTKVTAALAESNET
jgi:hypothetical protein